MTFYKYRIGFVLLFSKLLARIFHVEFPPVISCAGIIQRGNEILFLNLSYFNGYCLPGGIIQASESAEDALKREVFEETGLTVTRSTYLFSVHSSVKSIPTLSLIFKVEVDGKMKESKEGSLHWMSPNEAMDNMAYKSGEGALKRYLAA